MRTHGLVSGNCFDCVCMCVCVPCLFILQLLKGSTQSKPPCLRILRHSPVCVCVCVCVRQRMNLVVSQQAQGGGVTLTVLRLSGVSKW